MSDCIKIRRGRIWLNGKELERVTRLDLHVVADSGVTAHIELDVDIMNVDVEVPESQQAPLVRRLNEEV